MANVIFKSFQEASAFSKSLSMAIKASTSIKRDGDTWWVDDPRTGHDTSRCIDPDHAIIDVEATALGAYSMQYDDEGYDSKGYDSEGFNREGFDRNGRLRPF